MNWQKTLVVFRKEMLDTFRDRRFLYSAILAPILTTPVIALVVIVVGTIFVARAQERDQSVMFINAKDAPALMAKLEKVKGVEFAAASEDYVKRINDKSVQAAVEFPANLEEQLKAQPDIAQVIKVYFYQEEIRSRRAVRLVTAAIEEYSKEVAASRLSVRNLSPQLLTPFTHSRSNVATPENTSGNIIGFILPYMIIIFTLTGAMHPAIDTTAGEKERGTMETILASPAGRLDIVIGKFLLVLTVAVTTTVISLASMAATIVLAAQWIRSRGSSFLLMVSWKAFVAVLVLVLPLAVLFAATLLAISVFARNYKEAQGYIGPLMFLVILPAMGSFLPGVELTTRIALVPILNISLLTKEVFSGQFPWNHIAIIFGSTSVYAAIALYFALRLFCREEVLLRA